MYHGLFSLERIASLLRVSIMVCDAKGEISFKSKIGANPKWLVEGLDKFHMHFNSSHASNYLSIDGDIYSEKDKILNILKEALQHDKTNLNKSYRAL